MFCQNGLPFIWVDASAYSPLHSLNAAPATRISAGTLVPAGACFSGSVTTAGAAGAAAAAAGAAAAAAPAGYVIVGATPVLSPKTARA